MIRCCPLDVALPLLNDYINNELKKWKCDFLNLPIHGCRPPTSPCLHKY